MVGELLLMRLVIEYLQEDEQYKEVNNDIESFKKVSIKKFFDKQFYLFNVQFDNKQFMEKFRPISDTQLELKYSLDKSGKKWSKEDIFLLEQFCKDGLSFLEFTQEFERKPESIYKKMNTLGWTFQINGKGKLRLIKVIDEDKIEVNYNPKHLANGKFVLEDVGVFKSQIYLNFDLPVDFKNKKDLRLNLKVNNRENVEVDISKHKTSYLIMEESIKKMNFHTIHIANDYLGSLKIELSDLLPYLQAHKEIPLINFYVGPLKDLAKT
tara:strand:- start:2431 stop:3231 length:801 start_codon:yes stop_codon:yes gene_type:complete